MRRTSYLRSKHKKCHNTRGVTFKDIVDMENKAKKHQAFSSVEEANYALLKRGLIRAEGQTITKEDKEFGGFINTILRLFGL